MVGPQDTSVVRGGVPTRGVDSLTAGADGSPAKTNLKCETRPNIQIANDLKMNAPENAKRLILVEKFYRKRR